MSLAPRVLAAAGLLAIPALLAVGSQALSQPADIPLQEQQVVVIDLAPTGTAGSPTSREDAATVTPDPAPPSEPPVSPVSPSQSPSQLPETTPPVPVPAPGSEPEPAPAPVTPVDQGNPGLVEREVFDDDIDDDGSDGGDDDVDVDEDAVVPDGED